MVVKADTIDVKKSSDLFEMKSEGFDQRQFAEVDCFLLVFELGDWSVSLTFYNSHEKNVTQIPSEIKGLDGSFSPKRKANKGRHSRANAFFQLDLGKK